MSDGLLRYDFRMRRFLARGFGLVPLLAVLLVVGGNEAVAQDDAGGGEGGGSEISLYLGTMLPNQIDGVSEILPLLGGRYGLRTASLGTLEFGLTNTHAEGVDFTTFTGSIRADLPAMDGFFGIIYTGIDLNYYRPAGSEDRRTETGFHVGSGILMHASDTLWFRSDLKFMASPGTSLSLLFGLVFRTN